MPRPPSPRPLALCCLLAAAVPLGCATTGPPPPDGAETPAAEPTAAPPAAQPSPVEPPARSVTPAAIPEPRVAELAERAAQGETAARAELRALVAAHPAGAAGDQAALALGSLLVADQSFAEALALLRRAAAGEVAADYGALLFARAVAEGELAAAVGEARALLAPVVERADTPLLAGEARLRALQLAARAGAWEEAARHGGELLGGEAPPPRLDEVRWLTAEALRLAGRTAEALALYRALWLESPGSRWAREARDHLVVAGEETARAGGDRFGWIEDLQAAGLHREALAELAPMRGPGAEAEVRGQATYLAATSHHVLRENQAVVDLAAELRRASPGSPWAARAALAAMRALGRDDRTAEIRDLEAWLRAAHPAAEATREARYYLGSYLGGSAGEEEAGLAVLREVATAGGERAADALWRAAWLERRLGRDEAARAALAGLVASDTGPGYRAAALYWLARLAEDPAGERARELFATVRAEFPRDYYAVMAAERLRELGAEPAPLPAGGGLPAPDPLTDPAARPEPAYGRAVELRRLGLPRLAAAELATLDLDDAPGLALALAVLQARGGDTWSAIGTLLERFGDRLEPLPLEAPGVARAVWEAYYPFPYRETVGAAVARRAPDGHPFDPWLVAALARRESRFWPRAASPAGAVGAMQLMPQTAAAVAAEIGLEAPGRSGLLDPAVNLELGTAHLAGLVAAFEGEWAPALAAYNAGEQVVREWWEARPPGQPLDEWIEGIPYVETRLYVKGILGTYPAYRALYGPDDAAAAPAAPALPAAHSGASRPSITVSWISSPTK